MKRSTFYTIIVLALLAAFGIGAGAHHAWVTAHPCAIAPGGSIIYDLGDGMRQATYCEENGTVRDVSQPYLVEDKRK